jgi:hypothetical protein
MEMPRLPVKWAITTELHNRTAASRPNHVPSAGTDFARPSLALMNWSTPDAISDPCVVRGPIGVVGPRRGRIGHSVRDFNGRYPDDLGPARSRRRRLSVHRLHDLRSAGRLGNEHRRAARQARSRSRHRVERRSVRPEEMALRAAPRRQIPRRQRLRRRSRHLESRQGARRKGAAIRQAPERAGEAAAAFGGELPQDRRPHSRDHYQGYRLDLPLSDALVPDLESGAIREGRPRLGEVRKLAVGNGSVQAGAAGSARARRAREEPAFPRSTG